MAFVLDLTFTGLCVLVYDKVASPSSVAIVLTDGTKYVGPHKHLPFFSYNPKDLGSGSTSQKTHQLVPTPTGKDVALLPLAGNVTVDDPTMSGFTWSWAKSGKEPAAGEEKSLAWLPALYDVNSTSVPKPDASKPNNGLVGGIATIKLAGGVLEAGNLTQAVDAKYVLADFVYPDGSGAGSDTQVLADTLHLTISGLVNPITIAGQNWQANLRPAPLPGLPGGTGRVEASITNLPNIPDPMTSYIIGHFDFYYDLFAWRTRPKFRLPKLLGDVVTGSSGVCPPGRYGG
jgi:hypothetical protein